MSQFVKANSPSRKHRTRKMKLLNIHHVYINICFKCTMFSDVQGQKASNVSESQWRTTLGISCWKLFPWQSWTRRCVWPLRCLSPCVIRILQKQETCAAIDTPFQPVKMYTCIIRCIVSLCLINETICESVKMPHTAALFQFLNYSCAT